MRGTGEGERQERGRAREGKGESEGDDSIYDRVPFNSILSIFNSPEIILMRKAPRKSQPNLYAC